MACDFENSNLYDILRAIEDEDLLVELACDFAARVADDTDNPAQTLEILDTLSHKIWQKEPWLIEEAIENIREWTESPEEGAYTAGYAILHAAKAAWIAQSPKPERKRHLYEPVSKKAVWSAWYAAHAVDDMESEEDWQLEHTRKRMFCSCPLAMARPEDRDRVSLMAG